MHLRILAWWQSATGLKRGLRVTCTLGTGVAAALLCEQLHTPLPWMLGPLLAVAIGGMLGAPVETAAPLRDAGQLAIGTALGLYFTPDVLRTMAALTPALAAGIGWALLLGWLFYRLLARSVGARSPADHATAFFSAAIGGASEMVVLGEHHGGRIDRIAAAHTLRVLLVVVLIPVGFQLAGLRGIDLTPPGPGGFHPGGLLLLSVLALAGALALRRLRLPNPWVLGALAVSMALTASGVELSTLPKAVSNAAQLCIGVSLGTRFTPDFARSAPRWLGTVALGTLAMIVLSAGFAWLVATFTHLHWATVLLGTSPGGIAEMSITAKVMQLGVPIVTAFHVTRYVVVLLATAPLYRWLKPGVAR